MSHGLAIAVVGPSGAGKDTLMREALNAMPDLHLQRRVITRPADETEDFQPVSEARFAQMRDEGRFVLDWQAHGLRYGIPREALARVEAGEAVLLNLSRGALDEAARKFPHLLVLHVSARPEVLAARLAARGREDAQNIARRIARANGGAREITLPVTHIDNSGSVGDAVDQFLNAIRKART